MTNTRQFFNACSLNQYKFKSFSLICLLSAIIANQGISSVAAMQYSGYAPAPAPLMGDLEGQAGAILSQIESGALNLSAQQVDQFASGLYQARNYSEGINYFSKFTKAINDQNFKGQSPGCAAVMLWFAAFQKASNVFRQTYETTANKAFAFNVYPESTLAYKVYKQGEAALLGGMVTPSYGDQQGMPTPYGQSQGRYGQPGYPQQSGTMGMSLDQKAEYLRGMLNAEHPGQPSPLSAGEIHSFGEDCFNSHNNGFCINKFAHLSGLGRGSNAVKAAIFCWRAVFEKMGGNPGAQQVLNQALGYDHTIDKAPCYVKFKTVMAQGQASVGTSLRGTMPTYGASYMGGQSSFQNSPRRY
ncbi:hypothetical protein [Candidatus Odyssella thessalonicensis]|uniref:hypothetical protein n=1 Tax=Candidatus Odyssella thessalonicensis TaxID=84647 RepID=UPI000225B4C1|nr:hypothetical protein [Candidatus Odyssella thessalonicensis]